MELFGVGVPELIFIVIIAIIVLGPKDMAKAGTTIGKWLNDFVKSDTWKTLRDASKTVSALPTRLMREANLQELEQELKRGSIIPKMELPNLTTPASQIHPPATLPSDPSAVPAEEEVIIPSAPPPTMQPIQPVEPAAAAQTAEMPAAAAAQPEVQKRTRKPAAKKPASAAKSAGKTGAVKKSTTKTTPKPKTASKAKSTTKSKTTRVKKSNA